MSNRLVMMRRLRGKPARAMLEEKIPEPPEEKKPAEIAKPRRRLR